MQFMNSIWNFLLAHQLENDDGHSLTRRLSLSGMIKKFQKGMGRKTGR